MEVVQYCNGYVDYSKKEHVVCGMVKVKDVWTYLPNPLALSLAYEACPSCAEKELDQMGILPSELEKILSMSG